MDNQEETNDEAPKIKAAPQKAPKMKINNLAKPQVEGINMPKTIKPSAVKQAPAPITGPGLTEQEKQLVNEDLQPETEDPSKFKLMPESVIKRESQKHNHVKELLLVLVILLALVFGGYQAYLWRLNKKVAQLPSVPQASSNNTPANPETGLITSPITDISASASSTPTTTPEMSPTSSSTPGTSTPIVTATTLKITNTPTGYLNVRSTPSSSGQLVTQVHPGETYTYTAKQSGWYQITLNDGTSGWVSAQYVAVQ